MLRSTRCACAAVWATVAASCHVIDRVPDLRQGDVHRVQHEDRARDLAPTLTLTDDGRFRFVTPRVCPTSETVDMQASTVIHVRPNYATFIVGAITASLGGVGTAIALGEGDPSQHPLAYVSPVALAAGLVLAIGPFVGTRDDREYGGVQQVVHPGQDAPCGARPLAADRATLMWRGLRVVGTVDQDGVLSASPYDLVDAFAAGRAGALDITADVEHAGTHVAIQAVIASDALVKGKDAFLKRRAIDGTWGELRKVPRVEPGALRVSRVTVDGAPALRIVLPLANNGPGDAWQVRGLVGAQDPEVDGRVIYVGHIAPHAQVILTGDLPLSPDSDRALRGESIEVSVTLIDADATTSAEPVRFRGAVLEGVPK